MSGIEFRDGELVVEREPNDLDELALRFTSILEDLGVKHVYVSGYVAILAGRSRATEDIDVLLEPLDERMVSTLVERVREDGLWGPAMPLDSAMELLGNGDNVWVARDDEMVPHLEVKFVRDEFDRASLEHSVVARIAGRELPIGPLELQVAYKLYLGTRTDFEDAVHLYTLFEETLRTRELEQWVEKLDVHETYDRLESI